MVMEHNLTKSVYVSCSVQNQENGETETLAFCPNCAILMPLFILLAFVNAHIYILDIYVCSCFIIGLLTFFLSNFIYYLKQNIQLCHFIPQNICQNFVTFLSLY